MFYAFCVVLRELAELMLIGGALAASLRAARNRHCLPWVGAGSLAGGLIGVWATFWLASTHVDPRWAAVLTLVLALGVLVLVSGLLAGQGAIRLRVQVLVQEWLKQSKAKWLLWLFSFAVTVREVLEAGLFLRGLWLRTGGEGVLQGAVLGLVAALCLALAWRALERRAGVLAVFRLSAVLLSLMAIHMVLWSLGECLALTAPAQDWARHVLVLIAPVLPQGRWFGIFCAALMLLPVSYMMHCWWCETTSTAVEQ